MNRMTIARAFLMLCGAGLIPIALSYGIRPTATMNAIYGITINEVGHTHIMRVIMCLYFGIASLWLAGAIKPKLTRVALLVCGVFMLSIATGRLISFTLDGLPHWLFTVFAILEVIGGSTAFFFYRALNNRAT